jgi:hypothetical protein
LKIVDFAAKLLIAFREIELRLQLITQLIAEIKN